MACLASLAGCRTLRRTVASGTTLLGVFSVLWNTATPTHANVKFPSALPACNELASEPLDINASAWTDGEEEYWINEAGYSVQLQEDGTVLVMEAGAEPRAMGVVASLACGSRLMSVRGVMNLALQTGSLRWTGTGSTLTLGDRTGTGDGWSQDDTELAGQDVYLEGTPSVGGGPIEVTVSGVGDGVSMQNLTVGKTSSDITSYTFQAGGGMPQMLTVTGALTFRAGDVTFGSGTNALSLSAGSITVNSGNVTFQGSGALTVTNGVSVTGGKLIISSSGAKNFGTGIEVGANTELVVTVASGWGVEANQTNNSVRGDGTLVLRGVGETYTWGDDGLNGLLRAFLQYNGNGNNIATVKIDNGSYIKTGSSGDHFIFEHIGSDLWILDGGSLSVERDGIFSTTADGANKTLHLAGTGGDGTAGGALRVEKSMTMAWKMKLEADATVNFSGGHRLTLTNEYDGNSHKLTKGANVGIIQLGSNFTTKEGSIGSFEIAGGTMELRCGEDVLKNYDFILSGGVLDIGEAAAAGRRTIAALSGSGTVSGTGTLVIGGYGDAWTKKPTDAAFTGTLGANVEVAVDGVFILGDEAKVNSSLDVLGTLKINGSVTGLSGTNWVIGATGKLEIVGNKTPLAGVTSSASQPLTLRVVATSMTGGGKLRLDADALTSLAKLKYTGSTRIGGIKFDLTGTGSTRIDQNTAWTYRLFDVVDLFEESSKAAWEAAAFTFLDNLTGWQGVFNVDGSTGSVSYSLDLSDLTWNGTSFTWQFGSATEGRWQLDGGGQTTYVQKSNVTFNNATGGEINVLGPIVVSTWSIERGAWNITLNSGSSLSVLGDLTVKDGASLLFINSGPTISSSASIRADGSLDLGTSSYSGKSLTVGSRGEFSALNLSLVSGTLTLQDGARLAIVRQAFLPTTHTEAEKNEIVIGHGTVVSVGSFIVNGYLTDTPFTLKVKGGSFTSLGQYSAPEQYKLAFCYVGSNASIELTEGASFTVNGSVLRRDLRNNLNCIGDITITGGSTFTVGHDDASAGVMAGSETIKDAWVNSFSIDGQSKATVRGSLLTATTIRVDGGATLSVGGNLAKFVNANNYTTNMASLTIGSAESWGEVKVDGSVYANTLTINGSGTSGGKESLLSVGGSVNVGQSLTMNAHARLEVGGDMTFASGGHATTLWNTRVEGTVTVEKTRTLSLYEGLHLGKLVRRGGGDHGVALAYYGNGSAPLLSFRASSDADEVTLLGLKTADGVMTVAAGSSSRELVLGVSGRLTIEKEADEVWDARDNKEGFNNGELSIATLTGDSGAVVDGGGTLVVTKDGTYGGRLTANLTYRGQDGGVLTLSGETNIQTLTATSGTVKLTSSDARLRTLVMNGGGLELGAKTTLTVEKTTGGSGSLSKLQLGGGSTLKMGDAFSLAGAGAWGWGEGSNLELNWDGQKQITLSSGFSFAEGVGAENKLHILLSSEYMAAVYEQLINGGVNFFHLDGVTLDEGWSQYFNIESVDKSYPSVQLTDSGRLISGRRDGYYWKNEGGTWTDADPEGRFEPSPGLPTQPPRGQDVIFEDSSENDNVVQIDSAGVSPKNVYVSHGEFTFTSEGGQGLNMAMSEDGSEGNLMIYPDAKLHLNNHNTSISTVTVYGVLALGHESALPEETKLQFRGAGTLKYDSAPAQDVSKLVVSGTDTSTQLHVEVTSEAGGIEGGKATWGAASDEIGDNGGMKLAVNGGTVKTGAGNFTLAWKEQAKTRKHEGRMKVEEGTLTLDVDTSKGRTEMSGDSSVEENGVLELRAGGTRGMDYSGAVSGGGTLRVSEGQVTLSGSNSVSRIELGEDTVTSVSNGEALGIKGTEEVMLAGKLQLSNAEGAPVDVASKLHVQEGSIVNGKVTVSGELHVDGAATFQDETTLSGTVKADADATFEGKVQVTGKLTGSEGSLALGEKGTGTVSGDMSEFDGSLNTGNGRAWTLTAGALTKEIRASADGSGSVNFSGDAKKAYSGNIDDFSGTLRNSGAGALVITSEVGEGEGHDVALFTNESDGSIILGSVEKSITWNGSTLKGTGTVELANVEFTAKEVAGTTFLSVNTAISATGSIGRLSRAAAPQVIVRFSSGLDAARLRDIRINANGQLIGVVGEFKVGQDHVLSLIFSEENVSVTPDGGYALIVGGETAPFTLDATDAENRRFFLGGSAVTSIIVKLRNAAENNPLERPWVYLRALDNGTLITGPLSAKEDFEGDAARLLNMVAEIEACVEGNNIKLTGDVKDVYVSMPGEQTEYFSVLSDAKAILMANEGDILHVERSEEDEGKDQFRINNLLGVPDTTLHFKKGQDEEGYTVNFRNYDARDVIDGKYAPDVEINGTDVYGLDTEFGGTIQADAGVDVMKNGHGKLSVRGNYQLDQGDTTIGAGALELYGKNNAMDDLVFAYETAEQQIGQGEEERGLLLRGASTTTVRGSIRETEGKTGGDILLSGGAKLALEGKSELKHGTSITGSEGGGTIILKKDTEASLTFADEADADGDGMADTHLSGVAVEMAQGTTLDVGRGQDYLTALNGSGTLKSNGSSDVEGSGVLTVEDGSFSGTLSGSGKDGRGPAGTLVVADGKRFTLDNAKGTAQYSEDASAWKVKVGEDSKLTLDVGSSEERLWLGEVSLGDGGNMTVDFRERALNGDALGAVIVEAGEGAVLEFHSDAGVNENDSTVKTGIRVSEGVIHDAFKEQVKFTGAANFLKDHEVKIVDGEIQVTTTEAAENKLERVMPNAGKNGLAGATMLWDSLKDKSQSDGFFEALLDPDSDYKRLINDLICKFDNGETGDMERTLTSVAGPSIATLGPALAEDMHRQLKAMRNRTTTMGGEMRYDGYDNLPLWHAWISGEGGYHKMDADSFAPGYTLNNWGGTVGVDVDVSAQRTLGLALSAMYGNLKPDSADSATGHLDTMYLSAFLRAGSGRWIHTFVVSGGLADVKLDRTVNYGGGSYRTKGSTDGYALGALYEVGYTGFTNKKGTLALQPVFNVEVRHAGISGYNETDSDAGLRVDDMEQNIVTFGMGARLQSAVGENAFNRSSIFEARLLLKMDAGDRSGVAKNGIVGTTKMAEVESAEVGAVGVEAGAGLTIPLGSQSGSLFLDASLEYRRGWTSVNVSAGYRVDF